MSTVRITALAAALIAAASLTAGTAVTMAAAAQNRPNIPYEVTGRGYGTGSTYNAAKTAAEDDLLNDYIGCIPALGNLVYDRKGSDGIWSAEVSAECRGAS